MLYEDADVLRLFAKALSEKKDDKKDKKDGKKKKCSCKKKRGRGKITGKMFFHEKLAMTIFFSPFVLALPFLFNTFNLVFVYTGSWYIQYAEWTLAQMKAFPH